MKIITILLFILYSEVKTTWFKNNPLSYGQITYNAPLVQENFGDIKILNGGTPGNFDFIMIPSAAKTPDTNSRFTKFRYHQGTLTELESIATPTGSEFTVAAVVQDNAFVLCRLSLKPDVTCTYYPNSNLNSPPEVLLKTGTDASSTYANVGSMTIVVVPQTQYFLISAANDPLIFNQQVSDYISNGIGYQTVPFPNPNVLFFMLYQKSTNFIWIGRENQNISSFDYTISSWSETSLIDIGSDTPVIGAMASFDLNPNFAVFSISGNAVNLVDLVALTNRGKTGDLSVAGQDFLISFDGLKTVPNTNYIITKGGMVVITLDPNGEGGLGTISTENWKSNYPTHGTFDGVTNIAILNGGASGPSRIIIQSVTVSFPSLAVTKYDIRIWGDQHLNSGCDNSCASCHADDISTCTACTSGYIFSGNPTGPGQCIVNPSGATSGPNDIELSTNEDGILGIKCAGLFIKHCKICTDATLDPGNCDQCLDGYGKTTSSKIKGKLCYKCPIANCIKCDQAENNNYCTQCKSGYTFDNFSLECSKG